MSRVPVRLTLTALEARETPAGIGSSISNTAGNVQSAATVSIRAIWDVNRNGRQDSGDYYGGGTGAMVSSFQALTAAHVINDRDPRTAAVGFATWVEVIPGRNGGSRPFGSAHSFRLTVPQSWSNGDTRADLGVIHLSRNIGNSTGWFGYGNLGGFLRSGTPVRMNHYPGREVGLDGTRQYTTSGPVNAVFTDTFNYREAHIRSVPGSSGAPVYVNGLAVNGRVWNNTVVGINVRSDAGTSGVATSTRINDTWYRFIGDVLRGTARPSGFTAPGDGPTQTTGTAMPNDGLGGDGGADGQVNSETAVPAGADALAAPLLADEPAEPVLVVTATDAEEPADIGMLATDDRTPVAADEPSEPSDWAEYADNGLGLFAGVEV